MGEESDHYTVSSVRRRRRLKLATPIQNPKAVYELIRPLVKDESREHFYAIYLNARGRVLAVELVSVGSLNASIVHPREVFGPAMRLSAASLVVAHNHPSGETNPSDDDLNITRRLCEAGELLGIQVLDHVILANGAYSSLKEEGHL